MHPEITKKIANIIRPVVNLVAIREMVIVAVGVCVLRSGDGVYLGNAVKDSVMVLRSSVHAPIVEVDKTSGTFCRIFKWIAIAGSKKSFLDGDGVDRRRSNERISHLRCAWRSHAKGD
jgi:hypothetical protein